MTTLSNNKIKSNSVDIFDKQLIVAKKFEESGKIDEAINIYEECVHLKCEDSIPYDRLVILYRKKRQKDHEIRILKLAIQMFKQQDKYQVRLDKIQ